MNELRFIELTFFQDVDGGGHKVLQIPHEVNSLKRALYFSKEAAGGKVKQNLYFTHKNCIFSLIKCTVGIA